MKTDPSLFRDDDEFDSRVCAELAHAFEPGTPPAHLLRPVPSAKAYALRGLAAAVILALGMAGGALALRPPELVRNAIAHEYNERTLRGDYVDEQALLRSFGLAPSDRLPGTPQLMRLCNLGGQRAYHLTTYLEEGGLVTVFAFVQSAPLSDDSGWWDNAHWRIITSRDGRPLLLVSQQKQALAVASNSLRIPSA